MYAVRSAFALSFRCMGNCHYHRYQASSNNDAQTPPVQAMIYLFIVVLHFNRIDRTGFVNIIRTHASITAKCWDRDWCAQCVYVICDTN